MCRVLVAGGSCAGAVGVEIQEIGTFVFVDSSHGGQVMWKFGFAAEQLRLALAKRFCCLKEAHNKQLAFFNL